MEKLTLTNDNGRLSLAQRIFYEHNGFLMIPQLISVDILEKCNKRFEDYISGRRLKGNIIVMKDISNRKSVNKIQDILFDDIFCTYFKNKQLLDFIECFTGPNIMAMHSMCIAKPPDTGSGSSRHPPHQDLYYFPFRPADKIVASWTAIEQCNKQNGCLYILPGSHRNILMPHDYPDYIVNKMYHEIQNLSKSIVWIDAEMNPGDTLLFHPLLIHGSGINFSIKTRKAISCHYAAADCEYIDVNGTIQEKIKNEVTEILNHQSLKGLTYNDVWKYKSSIVRGFRSSL